MQPAQSGWLSVLEIYRCHSAVFELIPHRRQQPKTIILKLRAFLHPSLNAPTVCAQLMNGAAMVAR